MTPRLTNPSLYHFLCGTAAGIFIVLMVDYGLAMIWFWGAACAASMALSAFFRPCWDVDDVKRELRKRGYLVK